MFTFVATARMLVSGSTLADNLNNPFNFGVGTISFYIYTDSRGSTPNSVILDFDGSNLRLTRPGGWANAGTLQINWTFAELPGGYPGSNTSSILVSESAATAPFSVFTQTQGNCGCADVTDTRSAPFGAATITLTRNNIFNTEYNLIQTATGTGTGNLNAIELTPPIPSTGPQPCSSVTIDTSQSRGQIGVTNAGACDALLTIRNNRTFWTNFQISTVGFATATPVGGSTNLYAAGGLLPPSGLFGSSTAVQYNVHFSDRGDLVTIFVDPTGVAGSSLAKQLNMIQTILNAVPGGSLPQLAIVDYELVTQAFTQMPHLSGATDAL